MYIALLGIADAGSNPNTGLGLTVEIIGWGSNSLFMMLQTTIMWMDYRKKASGGNVVTNNPSLLQRFWPLAGMVVVSVFMWVAALYSDNRRDSMYFWQ